MVRSLLFAFLLFPAMLYAQEPANYKAEAAILLNAYNQDDFASLFSTFDKGMQEHLTPEKGTAFFSSMKQSLGSMKSIEFMKKEGRAAEYKAIFEKGVLSAKMALDSNNILTGLLFGPYDDPKYPVIERNTTKLSLPFKGKWYTVWGGDTKEQNYHVESRAQKNAFDFLMIDAKGNSYKNDGKKNEDYYAFGKEITAPCDAVVADAIDGVQENVPGEMNEKAITGNTVILKTANNEYLFFAHFKNHSVKVHKGDRVKKGQLLGLCGNSGHSSEPHLHFHMQNTDDLISGTGTKAYFEKLVVDNASGTSQKEDYSPVQGDTIKNP